MVDEPALLQWMLDTDPALRWQVERDLVGAPPEVWRATRARVATEGYGARLLARQDPDGQWAGGAYFPHDFDHEANQEGQPYTATTWTLNTLRDWGLDPAVLTDTAERLAANSRWEYDDLPYWDGEVDCCINGFTLANGAWLGVDVTALAAWFGEHRLADGGWNCEWVEGSTRSSFHSTLNTLKGLLAHETFTGGSDELRAVRRGGEEYLLQRRLTRKLSTGGARRAVGRLRRLPVPLGVHGTARVRLLPGRGAARRHLAGPPTGRRHRDRPRRPPGRRDLAAATPLRR